MIAPITILNKVNAGLRALDFRISSSYLDNLNILLRCLIVTGSILHPPISLAQSDKGPNGLAELIMTEIPGAPKLSQPILVTGNSGPLISQGHGLAAPAYWDWDGDGLKDLLIGEFGSGMEFGRYMGNFIRVFLNIGSEEQPSFDGGFDYARPPFRILTNGTPYSIDQFCCMPFMPQFTDLNGDGRMDLVSGQYFGEIIAFNGGPSGFLPGKPLPQDGNPRDSVVKSFAKNQQYWLYSPASFSDLTSDGKPDLIVGGRALRISPNVGSLSAPQFAQRKVLLDTRGNALKVYEYSREELASTRPKEVYDAGDYKVSPVVVDWDEDGVPDLLVTNGYNHKGLAAIDFFRGVKSGNEYRFEPARPLFTAKGGGKALPGSSPYLFVTDWNHDGTKDLLIGISIVTLNGKFNDQLSWNWEKDLGIDGAGKDPANLKDILSEQELIAYRKRIIPPAGITIDDFLTLRHQGYVYVMLGTRNGSPSGKTQKPGK